MPWARFETHPAHTRALGRLRQGVAVLAAGGSLALWLGRLPVTIALVASVGTLAALGWWRRGSREVRRAAQPEPDGLWLYDAGLLRHEAGARLWLPWHEVSAVSLDEERLRIRLHRTHAPDLYLDDHYPGHPLHEVAEALARGAGVPGPYQGSHSAHDDLQ